MGTTELANLPYPEGTALPFVHTDLKALADAVDERLPVTDAATPPPHKAGRTWWNPGLQIVQVSDGVSWAPLGVTVMGEVYDDVTGALSTNTVVLTKSITTLSGPAVVELTGWVVNTTGTADRSVNLQLTIDGAALGSSLRFTVPFEASQSPGRAVALRIPITAPGDARTYALVGTASATNSVSLRDVRLAVVQGGRAGI